MKKIIMWMFMLITIVFGFGNNNVFASNSNNTDNNILPYCDYDIWLPDWPSLSNITENYKNNIKNYKLLYKFSDTIDNQLDVKNNMSKILNTLCDDYYKNNNIWFIKEYNLLIQDYKNYEIKKDKLTIIWTSFLYDYNKYLETKNKILYTKVIQDIKLFVKVYKELKNQSYIFKNLKINIVLFNKNTTYNTSKTFDNYTKYKVNNITIIKDWKAYKYNYFTLIFNNKKHKYFELWKPYIMLYLDKWGLKLYYLFNI